MSERGRLKSRTLYSLKSLTSLFRGKILCEENNTKQVNTTFIIIIFVRIIKLMSDRADQG
jgi:hypothetical protein